MGECAGEGRGVYWLAETRTGLVRGNDDDDCPSLPNPARREEDYGKLPPFILFLQIWTQPPFPPSLLLPPQAFAAPPPST